MKRVKHILGSLQFMVWMGVVGSIIMVAGCAAALGVAPYFFLVAALVSWFVIVPLAFLSGWFWAEKHMSKDWPEERKTP